MALAVAPCARKIYEGTGGATGPQTHKTKGCSEMVDRWYHRRGAGKEQGSTARSVLSPNPQTTLKLTEVNNLQNYTELSGLKTKTKELAPKRPEALGARGGVWFLMKIFKN